MIRQFLLPLIVVLCAVAYSPLCAAEVSGSIRFADSLMLKGEYYRAITEYYRFNEFNPASNLVVQNNFKIAQCMELSNRSDEAILEYKYIAEKYSKYRTTALQKLSEIQSKSGKYANSNETIRELELLDKVDSDAVNLIKGKNYIYIQNYPAAKETFTAIRDGRCNESSTAGNYLSIMDDNLPLKKKSKLLGGLLGILPGGGYLYADRPMTALATLLVIGGFGYTTYESFNKDFYALGGVFAFATTGFYVGSIYGTVQAIGKYNNDRRIAFTKQFKF